MKYSIGLIIAVLVPLAFLSSCEKFFNPKEELNITEDQLFDDWYEYRSIEMGMYGLQQKLVEQLVVLGELRGDMLTITPNADADLVEIYNFNPSPTNRFASPTNFFKLISACNNFIHVLKKEHPEVLDPESPVTNYDRLYGEALCMRAWAYFNAARIYGKVPFIHESLVTMDEIESYINSSGTYIDSVYIEFNRNGYNNDTIYNHAVTLEKQMYDLDLIIDVFTRQLENEIKAVGVIHYIDNNDISWEITIWNTWALHALLGQMYLTQGDYVKAAEHYLQIIKNNTTDYRYQLTYYFQYGNWSNIFTNIDGREHIYVIWFNKANFQQNELQDMFEPWTPHKYMLKPTQYAVTNWESVWRGQVMQEDPIPSRSRMTNPGIPTDFYRGFGYSYLYVRNGMVINENQYVNMILLRAEGDYRSAYSIMEDMDTMVYKYSIGKSRFDQDANFIVYRAAGIHLNMAEIYTWWQYPDKDGTVKPYTYNAVDIVNDGSYYSKTPPRPQLGVRGRVGLGSANDGIKVGNINYIHDPFTNKIIGYIDLTGNFTGLQLLLEEKILDEKARELAFEGERFYDLMRAAIRRNNPSFLAKKVSAKYPPGKREQIYSYLLDENNWYIKYFE